MKKLSFLFLCYILFLPVPALASDPTPLIDLFVSIPLCIISILFFIICIAAPKVGAIMMGLLLVVLIPVMVWASDVGYLSSSGGWLIAAFFISVTGLLVALGKYNKANSKMDKSDKT